MAHELLNVIKSIMQGTLPEAQIIIPNSLSCLLSSKSLAYDPRSFYMSISGIVRVRGNSFDEDRRICKVEQ